MKFVEVIEIEDNEDKIIDVDRFVINVLLMKVVKTENLEEHEQNFSTFVKMEEVDNIINNKNEEKSTKAQEKKQHKQAKKKKDNGYGVTPSLKLQYNDDQGAENGVELSNEL